LAGQNGGIVVDFDPNCGADLLKHWQDCWADIHCRSESNAKKAGTIDGKLCELHSWLEAQWQYIHQLNVQLSALPDLVQRVDAALESIGTVRS
jgi:hypothetical protein